jgi:L-ascorbate metabolism protein UlaG (beta-lactamase superfamily)
VLTNGQTAPLLGVQIEAVAAYNLTADRAKFHAKGRGNGYVLTLGDKRVYLSGDTEDIPEMRALKNIEVAFLCMNLPYTMTVEQAASAVRAFRPKIVYPYHCRGSDLGQFKKLVGEDSGVEVRIRDWYAP